MSEKVYSIKDMEVISGIKAHTIRMWERRYGLLKPSRTGTNIRFYDDQELRRLMNVAHLVGCHYKISKVARMDDDQLRRLVLAQNELHAGQEAIISQFVMHMLHFDSAGFSRLLSEVMARYGFEEAVFRVIFPFLNKVGTFWQVGSVYPAQEHFISAMIRHQFICELERRQLEPKGEKSMLFFLHENELHELPLLYYAAVAARKGFRIIYLGPGVPLSDLEHLDVLAGVTHVLTVFTNALEHEELNTILQRLTGLLPGKEFIISGHQLKLHSLKLPEGFTLISNYHDFDAMFP